MFNNFHFLVGGSQRGGPCVLQFTKSPNPPTISTILTMNTWSVTLSFHLPGPYRPLRCSPASEKTGDVTSHHFYFAFDNPNFLLAEWLKPSERHSLLTELLSHLLILLHRLVFLCICWDFRMIISFCSLPELKHRRGSQGKEYKNLPLLLIVLNWRTWLQWVAKWVS